MSEQGLPGQVRTLQGGKILTDQAALVLEGHILNLFIPVLFSLSDYLLQIFSQLENDKICLMPSFVH